MPEPRLNTHLGGFFQFARIPLPHSQSSLSCFERYPRNEAASGWWVPVNFSTEEEIQQVSYFQLSQTFLTILSCKGLHKCRAVESQDTGFEQVKMQDVIRKSNYILIA